MSNIDRKLATIRVVSNLIQIEGADLIELAQVDGWKVVVKKGEFSVGDPAVYFEIDSWIPHTVAPFLTKPGQEPKVFNEVPGQRLKTMKMKGVISQGLLLPWVPPEGYLDASEGDDLTELFGIQKWERPISAQLAGTVKGNFPSFIPKTDQERIQNCFHDVKLEVGLFEVTEKMHGSSMTVYLYQDDEVRTGVCSRNLDLKDEEGNTFWMVAHRDNLVEKIKSLRRNLAFQGELCGPGINGNNYRLTRPEFFLFDIYDIDSQEYLSAGDRERIAFDLDIKHVPIIGYMSMSGFDAETSEHVPIWSIDGLLSYAEQRSVLAEVEREGIVWKKLNNPSISFKVISNKWLLKEKE